MLTATAPASRIGVAVGGEAGGADRPPSAHLSTLQTRCWRPVDAASTIAFRVAMGLLGAFSAARFLANGWVEAQYLAPNDHLTYPWFPWVRPLPGAMMYVVVAAMIPLGIAVAAGWRTRLSAAAFVVVFAYCELIEASLYLNHYWFVTLAMALLAVLPTSGPTVPALLVWVLRLQVGVVYVMAGLAKLNHDWLVGGEPMTTWLAGRTELPIVGPQLGAPWVGHVASWLGAAFDLTIVGWLLWPRTRPFAYAALVVFHVLTWRLFAIGVFPWVMIAVTPIFFAPCWPRCVASRTRRPRPPHPFPQTESDRDVRFDLWKRGGWGARVAVGAAVAWAVLQLAVPLRHLAYAGDVRWTEEGYYGSFRVMLTEKAGLLRFTVTDPSTGESWTVAPTTVLTDWQARQAAIRPELSLAAAHLVADDFADRGRPGVAVQADSWVSFNGRQRQRMIDPTVDLASLGRRAPSSAYVLPLDPPVLR